MLAFMVFKVGIDLSPSLSCVETAHLQNIAKIKPPSKKKKKKKKWGIFCARLEILEQSLELEIHPQSPPLKNSWTVNEVNCFHKYTYLSCELFFPLECYPKLSIYKFAFNSYP